MDKINVSPDKIFEIDQRINGLEERLKLVFSEIEKRLDQVKPHEEYSTEERLQEMEDLMLLLQLETTKIREKVGETSIDFGLATSVPDAAARLTRIEEELGRAHNNTEVPTDGADAKIAQLEEKIKALEERPLNQSEKQIKSGVHDNIKELEKRIRTLEALLERRGQKEMEHVESHLLSDIQDILRH